MPENTDEEHLDNPAILLSESLSYQDNNNINPGINNTNQETENMEVHKHPVVGK